ncbi:hypothetical protein SVIO_061860 [Streptomyces violaceusniger]|uniref:Uncharacterized protein n=1 Tax=Streptomyces violaceusniger TaxID=68280 RepID=A0A4D4LBU6_STRVO|nr:hypothetical protein SVIO_061860 [Streptomyces violaceusniger]
MHWQEYSIGTVESPYHLGAAEHCREAHAMLLDPFCHLDYAVTKAWRASQMRFTVFDRRRLDHGNEAFVGGI